jgi:prepilin-type N-terminal cleavage/methylation domain-containing protein
MARVCFVNYDKKGFSLVELSLVLVVLGLVTGGILAGQSLIRAAEIRSIVNHKESFVTAINVFQDKYNSLPGDMTNATAFWGTKTGGACPEATVTAGTQTCNGNGDGRIQEVNTNAERYLILQHLGNAGLISGNFSGTYSGTTGVVGQDYFIGGMNIYWIPVYRGVIPVSDTNRFEGNYDNDLGLDSPTSGENLFSPEEAWGIDKKIDDGMPGLGNFVTREAGGVACNNVAASNAVALANIATYNLQNKSKACRITWRDAF